MIDRTPSFQSLERVIYPYSSSPAQCPHNVIGLREKKLVIVLIVVEFHRTTGCHARRAAVKLGQHHACHASTKLYRTCDGLGVYSLHHACLFRLVHVVSLRKCLQCIEECGGSAVVFCSVANNTRTKIDGYHRQNYGTEKGHRHSAIVFIPLFNPMFGETERDFLRPQRRVVAVLVPCALYQNPCTRTQISNLPNGALATPSWA